MTAFAFDPFADAKPLNKLTREQFAFKICEEFVMAPLAEIIVMHVGKP